MPVPPAPGDAELTVTIHQPDHLPWLGLLNKIDQADLFVVLDCVQLSKRAFHHRNRVIGFADEPTWLTVPLATRNHCQHQLRDMAINNRVPWQRHYWNILYARYHRHPGWEVHRPYLTELLNRRFDGLVDLNLDILRYFLGALGISTPMIIASTLAPEGKSSALMLDICRKVGARTYLAGPLSRLYLCEDGFRSDGIALRYHEFNHPTYAQFGREGFVSHLCTLDLLMNQLDGTLETIRRGSAREQRPQGIKGVGSDLDSEPCPGLSDRSAMLGGNREP
jgi:hypothetical protein